MDNNKPLNGHKTVIINLAEGMNDRIVLNSEEKIIQLERSKEAMLPTYNEKKDFFDLAQREYNEVKVQMENLDEEIRKQNIIIDTFKNFSKHKDRILQTTVEKEKRMGTKAPKRISWLDEACEVLSDTRKFMKPIDVFNAIIVKPHIQEAFKEMKSSKNPAAVKGTTIDNMIDHALKTVKGRYTAMFKPKLTVYKEKLGLPEWMDKDNIPQPKYMKEFMYEKA